MLLSIFLVMLYILMRFDMRFGPGTWRSIVDERARRIQEAREQAAIARREQIKKSQEMEENIKTALLVIGVIIVSAGLFFIMMISIAKGAR